jgi:hypothetical protein
MASDAPPARPCRTGGGLGRLEPGIGLPPRQAVPREGKITGKKGETFTAGRLGTYTIGDDGEVILGLAVIVTPQNVDEFKL